MSRSPWQVSENTRTVGESEITDIGALLPLVEFSGIAFGALPIGEDDSANIE